MASRPHRRPQRVRQSTIAREFFGDRLVSGWPWPENQALVDGFPAEMQASEITGLLSRVGLSSPPSWVKPFQVLSNGEQFRANLARTLAEQSDIAVVDEFTSVVDRTVAKIGSAAVAKCVRSSGRRFVAVTCHYDVEDWLQPDWKYDVQAGKLSWRLLQRRPEISLHIRKASKSLWPIFGRHHYLNSSVHAGSQCFVGEVEGQPAAFVAVLHSPGRTSFWREHRCVCLPLVEVRIREKVLIVFRHQPAGLLEGIDDGRIDSRLLHVLDHHVFDMLGMGHVEKDLVVGAGLSPVLLDELLTLLLKKLGHLIGDRHGFEQIALTILLEIEILAVATLLVLLAAAAGTRIIARDSLSRHVALPIPHR